MRRVDLTGKRFDKLICLQDAGLDKTGSRLWLCQCDCGNHVFKRAGVLTGQNQRVFACKECGRQARMHPKHGDSALPLYNAWRNMRARCRGNTPKNQYWAGKGIKVCDSWNNYLNFRDWASLNGYEEGLALDRINPDGDYEPGNCRWVTVSQNTLYSLERRYGK